MGIGSMGLSPQMLQMLMQQMQKSQGGGQPSGAPPMPQMPQGQPPMIPQSPGGGQPPKLGGNNIMLPGGTASPGVPGVQMSATPPKQAGSTSARGIASLPGAVMAVKQSMQRSKTEKARQLTGQYLAMKGSDDPKIQKMADQLLADPKNHKVFDKATTDPNSPEYAGVQMAYRDVVGQEQQAAKMEEMQQKVKDMQAMASQRDALAQRERALAAESQKKTEQMGTVTDADKFKADQKKQQILLQVTASMQRQRQSIDAMKQRADAKITSMERIAAMHEREATKRTGMRVQQNYALTAMTKEYANVQREIATLDKEQKAMQDDLVKNPLSSWATGKDDEFQAKSTEIDAKRQGLEARLQALDTSVDAMTKGGVIPREQNPPPPGTHIVVRPEDMR